MAPSHSFNASDKQALEHDFAKVLLQSRKLDLQLSTTKAYLAHTVHLQPLPQTKQPEQRSFGSLDSTNTTLTESSFLDAELGLPKEKYHVHYRKLRWSIFSVYRRLNFLVIAINVIIIIALAAHESLTQLGTSAVATAVAANILVAVVMRQELVINLLFIIFGLCPSWFPLRVRRLAAKIYHLGGVHSGAATAGYLWFFFLSAAVFKTLLKGPITGAAIAVMIITLILHILLTGIMISSHPKIRQKYHDAWEATHRYAGWTSVGLLWVHLILSLQIMKNHGPPGSTFAQHLYKSPVFWCLLVITVSLILPWLRLRKVDVISEQLSNHAIRLHFKYTNLPLCAAPRLAENPWRDWHAFAGIPEENGIGFSVLVSKAGDWTGRMIKSPPTKLWVRGIPVRGVLHIAPMFKMSVIVATGSGIGPVLSLLNARQVQCRILWSTPDPLKTYKQGVIDKVMSTDPNAVIINTTKTGRPDLSKEAYKLYHESNAEAVFVISNPRVTRKLVYNLESRGIPIFAPIFDS